jgi:hypothetical protein
MRRFFYVTLSGLLMAASSAQAQGYHSEGARRKSVPIGSNSSRNAVSTHPSNSPFSNPISQPLPPAVSVNPAQNSNRSTVPLQTVR